MIVRPAVDTRFDEVLTAGIAGAVALWQRVAEVKAAVLPAQEVGKVVALSCGIIKYSDHLFCSFLSMVPAYTTRLKHHHASR